ncbi:MAG: carboxypeptidase regulatory-like domain-containing protein [Bryobacterales bacterium]|nr:carboxypeptidase regulatory-like domain-containing protein [Bryobacterales bacterium]
MTASQYQEFLMPRISIARLLVVALFCGAALLAQNPNKKDPGYGNWLPGSQKDKKGDDPNVRAVTGTVRLVDDSLVEGAVVQLKNTKTMQVRSFITKADGMFQFQGLSTNVDYEIKAEAKGMVSPARTLSTFDDRKRAIMHLKLENKKQ